MASCPGSYSLLSKRLEPFQLSASCMPGNLAIMYDSSRRECCGYAIAHGSQVVVMKWRKGAPIHQHTIEPFTRSAEMDSLTFITGVSGKYTYKNMMTYLSQIKWCELSSGHVFVITSFSGFTVNQ